MAEDQGQYGRPIDGDDAPVNAGGKVRDGKHAPFGSGLPGIVECYYLISICLVPAPHIISFI